MEGVKLHLLFVFPPVLSLCVVLPFTQKSFLLSPDLFCSLQTFLYAWQTGLSPVRVLTWAIGANLRCAVCSAAELCLTLCNPLDCSSPGFSEILCLLPHVPHKPQAALHHVTQPTPLIVEHEKDYYNRVYTYLYVFLEKNLKI